MKIIVLLVFLSLFLAAGFLWAFFYSVKNGQFDDDTTPAMRMLFDDELTTNDNEN